MRNNFLSLLSILLLASCSATGGNSSVYDEHSYDEVNNLLITYDQSFSISENDHYIYFYSDTCHSCQEIKNEVIDFALNEYAEMYFVIATIEIPHNYGPDEFVQTLGSNNIDDVWMGVTPQLAFIKNGKIEKNITGTINIEQELSYYRN